MLFLHLFLLAEGNPQLVVAEVEAEVDQHQGNLCLPAAVEQEVNGNNNKTEVHLPGRLHSQVEHLQRQRVLEGQEAVLQQEHLLIIQLRMVRHHLLAVRLPLSLLHQVHLLLCLLQLLVLKIVYNLLYYLTRLLHLLLLR